MTIYFLRHGDAANASHLADHERPLTERGIEQATLVGAFLRRTNIQLDAIFSSPLERACQTAAIVQSGIGGPTPAVSELLVNGSDHDELLEFIGGLGKSSVLLVGHVPHLPDTISFLIGRNHAREIEMKKCSLAVVQAPEPLTPGTGLLKQLTHVDAIAKLIQP